MRRSTLIPRPVHFLKVVCVIAATAPFPLLAIEPTVYEQQMLAERRSMVQLHLEMDSELAVKNGVLLTRTKRVIWQDGDKRRCDEIREYLDGKGVTEVPPYRVVSVETPEYLFHWDGRPQPPPFKRVAHFHVPTEKKRPVLGSSIPDARPIGLTYTFVLHLRERDWPWDLVIGTPERLAPAMVETNGDKVSVSFTCKKNSSQFEVKQVYEKRGEKYLLLSLAVTGDGKSKEQLTMECRYPDILIAGLAFPNFVECKQVLNNTVKFHDKSSIRLKSVNEALPVTIFSIEAVELPKGTPVNGDAIPPELKKPFHHIQWDGQALVPVSNKEIMLSKELEKPKWTVGQIAPPIEGEDLSGNPLRLEDYRGKVVLLVFWGSWCGPCMAMVPHERKLHDQFRGRPFALVGVNCGDTKEKANAAIEANNMSWRSVWDGDDRRGSLVKKFDVRYWPTTFLVDAQGKFRAIDLRGEELDKAIEAAIVDAEQGN